MSDRPGYCVAYQDQSGEYVCNRCGTQWDADDNDPPDCKSWDDIKADKVEQEQRERDHDKQHGRAILEKLKQDLNK